MLGRHSYQKGFTIVELLIVVVVIAILAAITIVAYTGVQNRAYDSAAQADLSNFFKKLETLRVDDSGGKYMSNVGFAAAVPGIGIKLNTNVYSTSVTNNFLYCRSTDGLEIAFVAMSKSNNAFYISTISGGIKSYTWSWTSAQATTCNNIMSPGTYSGNWGYSAGTWNYGT